MFCETPEECENFMDIFNLEVEKFKVSVEGLDEATILCLTAELPGKIESYKARRFSYLY